MMMIKTLKYRLYPTQQQIEIFQHWLDICREIYNAGLQERRTAWERLGRSVSLSAQKAQLPGLKQDIPEVASVHSQVLQDVLLRLDKAFKAFYRRCHNGDKPGYPRFKSGNRYHSFTFPQWSKGAQFQGQNGKLWLSKIGAIKIKLHRPMEGRIKTVTIVRKAGRWYACFSVDSPFAPHYDLLYIDINVASIYRHELRSSRWLDLHSRLLASSLPAGVLYISSKSDETS
ncbi:MAG: RNA-guided endonuclease InsQ/TnpB family protein [Candidatus Bipolaricaulia bacterium]